MNSRDGWAVFIVATVATLIGASGPVNAQASFQGLGFLPGSGVPASVARGVSADGSTVVGWSNSSSGTQGFLWTSSTGMVPLGALTGYATSDARGVSRDGSVVVGDCQTVAGTPRQAFRRTSGGGMVGLGWLWGDPQKSWAMGVSRNGSVVVGSSYTGPGDGNPEAFRWTAGVGMVGLGDLPGGFTASYAAGVSPDGSVVVGESYVGFGGYDYEAFRWTSQEGMVGLGDLPGGEFRSTAWSVCPAGVIVGEGYSDSGREAARWTPGSNPVGLGDLPDGAFSSAAFGVSDDGTVIVGEGSTASGSEAFLYTTAGGMVNLRELLVNNYGLDLTGWTLTSASAVSADGRTIVGNGLNVGKPEAWVARIPGPGVPARSWQVVSATGPSARDSSGMAYDFLRQQVVLFGGNVNGTALDDTWIWSGSAWTRAYPSTSPPARAMHMMTGTEPGFGEVLLFGGGPSARNDTWEWQGGAPFPALGTWMLQTVSPSPGARYSGAMAYDPIRGAAILFGGAGNISAGADTWEYSGQWQQLEVPGPSARYYHAMAFDRSRDEIVLFGGMARGGPAVGNGETWVWNGSQWIERFPEPSPPGRYGHAMAYDPSTGRVVLFGGLPSWSGNYLQDTWEWDGINWTQVFPSGTPPGRVFASMSEDSRGRVILFGGESFGFYPRLSDWRSFGFDGRTWAYVTSTESPSYPGQFVEGGGGNGQCVGRRCTK